MKTWKKTLFIIIGILLFAAGVLLIIQAVHYNILDHSMQIAKNGFYKNDVTMLTYGQKTAMIACWIFGSIGSVVGIGIVLYCFNIIGLK